MAKFKVVANADCRDLDPLVLVHSTPSKNIPILSDRCNPVFRNADNFGVIMVVVCVDKISRYTELRPASDIGLFVCEQNDWLDSHSIDASDPVLTECPLDCLRPLKPNHRRARRKVELGCGGTR